MTTKNILIVVFVLAVIAGVVGVYVHLENKQSKERGYGTTGFTGQFLYVIGDGNNPEEISIVDGRLQKEILPSDPALTPKNPGPSEIFLHDLEVNKSTAISFEDGQEFKITEGLVANDGSEFDGEFDLVARKKLYDYVEQGGKRLRVDLHSAKGKGYKFIFFKFLGWVE